MLVTLSKHFSEGTYVPTAELSSSAVQTAGIHYTQRPSPSAFKLRPVTPPTPYIAQ